MTTTPYTIRLQAGPLVQTAYAGKSYKAARETVDLLRATLILGKGTAQIWVSYQERGGVLLQDIQGGYASMQARF